MYRGAELEKIGMPVGGICAGQLYLGGDGKLWHWDIFNQPIAHRRGQLRPAAAARVAAGARFRLEDRRGGEDSTCARLDQRGFRDVAFRGEYPIGLVEYAIRHLPVAVSLEAFSPFIPLNADDSALPATMLRFTVKNIGSENGRGGAGRLAGERGRPVLGRSRIRHAAEPRRSRARGGLLVAVHVAVAKRLKAARPDVVFEDFQKETYEGWTVPARPSAPGRSSSRRFPLTRATWA